MGEAPAQNGYPVEFPSGGRYYESGSARAVLSVIRGEQEALIADANPQTFPQVLDQVLRKLTSDLPVKQWGDLLIGDKYALIFYLRQISYGYDYSFTITCPNCKTPNEIDLDIREAVTLRTGDEDATEPFEVHLPFSDRTVKFRLMRVSDEQDMIKFVRKQRQKDPKGGDPGFLYALARGILEVDGVEVTLEETIPLIKELAAPDTIALRDALDEYDVGPELELDFTCQNSACAHYFWQMMPLEADFFRPGSAKRRRSKGSNV